MGKYPPVPMARVSAKTLSQYLTCPQGHDGYVLLEDASKALRLQIRDRLQGHQGSDNAVVIQMEMDQPEGHPQKTQDNTATVLPILKQRETRLKACHTR